MFNEENNSIPPREDINKQYQEELNNKSNILDKTKEKWFNIFGKTGKIGEYVFMILIGIVIVYSIMFLFTGGHSNFKQTNKEVNQISKQIDTLKQHNEFLIKRFFELEKNDIIIIDKINENNQFIKKQEVEFQKLRKIYNEKITNVDRYDLNDIDSFFAERYKEYYIKE